MNGPLDSGFERDPAATEGALAVRVDAVAAELRELQAEVRASAVAGDTKTLKELAKVLDAWSKHDPKLEQRVTSKVDALGDRIAILTQRLETLATTVATTASGLAGREGDVAALRRRVDEQNAAVTASLAELAARVDPKPLVDLKEKVYKLAGEGRTLKRDLHGLTDGTISRTDQLAARIETLGGAVNAGAAALAAREQEISELRATLEDRIARTEASVARAAEQEEKIATITAELTEHGSVLGELRTTVSETSTEVDAAVTEFRRSVNGLASTVTRLDEAVGPGAMQGLGDQLATLRATFEDSVRRLASLEVEAGATTEREAKIEADVAALRKGLGDRQERAESALGELHESIAGLSVRLSTFDDVAGGETVRRLDAHLGAVREELDGLALRVGGLTANLEEAQALSEEKAKEVEALALRFDHARTRIEALIGDLQEALATMPTSSAPDPVLVESVDEVTGRVAALGDRLQQLETSTRQHVESAASRDAELERDVADSVSRLVAVERDQSERALETSQITEQSGAELAQVRRQLETLEARYLESARAIERAVPLLDDVTARLDGIDAGRGSLGGEIARVSDVVEGETSALRQELERLQDAVTRLQEAPMHGLARVTERLGEVERDLAARASEVAHVSELSASERLWVRQQLEALASAQADVARADTDVVPLVDELAARVDAIKREQESGSSEASRVSELIAAERSMLHEQLEAFAVTLTEQMSRRGERLEALEEQLVARLDALERAGVGATSEIERLAALHSTELAAVEARLAETLSAVSERVPSGGNGAVGPRSSPDASDGRLRVELRSLGLRMEHAEAAAKEGREAVLDELERLTSRFEQLESRTAGEADRLQEVDELVGDVVPIRGDA